MKHLTSTQSELLTKCRLYTSVNCPIKYDVLKSLCNVKTFDTSFNALFFAGYFERVKTNDFSNYFKLVK